MIETVMPTQLSVSYVVASYLISALGAFVALTAAGAIARADGALNRFNLLAAGLALGGIGIWSMHFVGMLALKVELGVGYAMTETLVSLVAAVAGSAIGLNLVARNPGSFKHILLGGAVLGTAVCVMHYLGMYGMRFGGFFNWSWSLVAVSVLIAFVAATAALWLAFSVRGFAARLVAALIMAGAVCAMHYTGMAAAEFVCTTAKPMALPQGFGVVASFQLPTLVIILSLGMAFLILIDQFFQRVVTAMSN